MSEVVSVPRELKDVFKSVSAEVQTYLNTAQKFSKSQKHFYIGVEHLFAAFLSEQKSLIRRILADDKSNWKKRVQDLLLKAYNPSKRTQLWQGILVTPRLQRIWDQAILSTRFKDSTEVKEAHILAFMLKDKEGFPYRWLEGEDYRIDDFISRINEEAFPDAAAQEKAAKTEDAKETPKKHDQKAQEKKEPVEEKKPEPAAPKVSLTDIFKRDQDIPSAKEETLVMKGGLAARLSGKEEKKPPSRRDEGDALKIGPDIISIKSLVEKGVSPAGISRLKEMQKKCGEVPPLLMIGAREVPFEELIDMNLEEEAFLEVLDIAEENVEDLSQTKDETFPDMGSQRLFQTGGGNRFADNMAFNGAPAHVEPVAMGEGKPLDDLLKIALETQAQDSQGSDLDTTELKPMKSGKADRASTSRQSGTAKKSVPDIGGQVLPDIGKRVDAFTIGFDEDSSPGLKTDNDLSPAAHTDNSIVQVFSADLNAEKPLFIGDMTQNDKPAKKTGQSKVYDPFGLLGDVEEQGSETEENSVPDTAHEITPKKIVHLGIGRDIPEVEDLTLEETPNEVKFEDKIDLVLDDAVVSLLDKSSLPTFKKEIVSPVEVQNTDTADPFDLLDEFPPIAPIAEATQDIEVKPEQEVKIEPVPQKEDLPDLADVSGPKTKPSLVPPAQRVDVIFEKHDKSFPIVPRRRVMMPRSDEPIWMLDMKKRITLKEMQTTMMEQAKALLAIQKERREKDSEVAVMENKEASPPPVILGEEAFPKLPEVGGDVALPEFTVGLPVFSTEHKDIAGKDTKSIAQDSLGDFPIMETDDAVTAFPEDDDLLSIFPDETFDSGKSRTEKDPAKEEKKLPQPGIEFEAADFGLNEILIDLNQAGLQEMYPSDLWDDKEVNSIINAILSTRNHSILISRSLIKAGKVVSHLKERLTESGKKMHLYMLICEKLSQCTDEEIVKHINSMQELFSSKKSVFLLSFDVPFLTQKASLQDIFFQFFEYLLTVKMNCTLSMNPQEHQSFSTIMARTERLFKMIPLNDVTDSQARDFLRASKSIIERELKISIEPALIEQAAELTKKFLAESIFPESIIEVFRRASQFKREEFGDIGLDEIEHIDKKDFLYILSDSSL